MTSFPNLRALLLDVGGVLMDERPSYRHFRRQACARLKGVSARDMVAGQRAAIGANPRPRWISQETIRRLGGDPEVAWGIWEEIDRRGLDRPYAEAPAALERLGGRYRLAILGNQGLQARGRLEAAGLLRFFEVVVISDEVGVSKPDPRIFELALEQLGVAPCEAAMVGDRLDNDIGPAKRLGIIGIRMWRGPHVWQRPIDACERPDLTVRSLTALARVLNA
ncbi:MAG TPA: HAD family hydrolase [Steroidobacteraceae bacterium]|nr:HAD family hydrolase [Steroidobacteraceae bacterium]